MVHLKGSWSYAGDIVRIQPNHISFNSLAAVEDIHGVRTKALKTEAYSNVMKAPIFPASLFSTV